MDPMLVLKGALPPILAALLLVSLAGVRLLPLAAAIGLFVAYGLLKQWQDWPTWPHELWAAPNGTMWLLWGVFAVALIALLEHLRLLPRKLGMALGLSVGAAAVWFLLQKVAAANQWTALDLAIHVGGGGFAVALLVLASRTAIERGPSSLGPAIVFSTMLSADAAIIAFSSGLLGQLCGVVAAAVGAAAGTSLWRRPFALRAADGTWLGAAHGLFLLAGVHLSYVSWASAGCALLAPCTLLLLRPSLAAKPAAWTVAGLLLTLIPLGAGGWFAFAASTNAG